jgi:glycosyltransferase involved in cell wall biosynthesis
VTTRVENSSELATSTSGGITQLASKPARVLHVNSGNLFGGVETILVTLARLRELCPAIDPHYGLCHEGRLSHELLATGASVHILGEVRISRPWTVRRARRRLRDLLKTEYFDLVICHMPWSLAVFGPVVGRAGMQLGFWAHSFHAGRNWLERLARRTRPDVAIANSRFTADGLRILFPRTPRGVVYPPICLIESPDASQWRSDLRKRLGVNEAGVVIIQVSRMEPCKGHSLHVEALARLKDMDRPWSCWMVGGAQTPSEKHYMQKLQDRVQELGLEGRVHFLGQRADIRQLLAAADIFCQPNSSPDSFGIAMVEALWAGRPVVTTAMGGPLEILDESCGVLVKADDAPALSEALRRLIESSAHREGLGQAGPARAMQLCDPAAQMRKLLDLMRRIPRKVGDL